MDRLRANEANVMSASLSKVRVLFRCIMAANFSSDVRNIGVFVFVYFNRQATDRIHRLKT